MSMFDFFKIIRERNQARMEKKPAYRQAREKIANTAPTRGSIESRYRQSGIPAGTGLTTTKTIRGNTAMGPAGGTATSYTTRDTRGGGGQSPNRSAATAKTSYSSGKGGYGRANQTGSKARAGGLIRDGKHKRMMDGGMADMRRPGTMVQPGVPSGPSRPISPRGYGPNDGGPRPMGPRITPVNVTGMPVGGPKTGVKPYDGKPANPRVTYGPRTPGPKGPMVQPGVPSGPSRPIIPQGASDLQGMNELMAAQQTPTKDMGRASLTFRKGGAVKSKAMRGGGLARKGVGMALAKGGLARRAGGCAKRGVGKGRMV